ncbi:hypothetical protein SEA_VALENTINIPUFF_8 [Microbacterium phage ValentiniPuff]|uniref:Uncharacterized protein n=1 Tax=Microbacterium phage ValentiniPuff TaxID=2315705 RepID=A0A386KPL9_9CAUD|nr:hypothetical protein SEA_VALENTINIPUFF_8 [Microbacterium phage ValentiniPuff]
MTTTLEKFAGKQAANYSTNPTIDVEILEVEDNRPCSTCGLDTVYNSAVYSVVHVDADGNYVDYAVTRHTPTRESACSFCGAIGTTTLSQHAWHDAVSCSRCGGIQGWSIGD